MTYVVEDERSTTGTVPCSRPLKFDSDSVAHFRSLTRSRGYYFPLIFIPFSVPSSASSLRVADSEPVRATRTIGDDRLSLMGAGKLLPVRLFVVRYEQSF